MYLKKPTTHIKRQNMTTLNKFGIKKILSQDFEKKL